ncbi:MAG: riboflavin biosynthesis protein RibD [Alphaproteobacteria bacterium PA2]|nr:MAG: riboflavin biosynthesis protein RibD [Alphaproteobacteria bacterium PA2]
MRRAIELARTHLGQTAENPSVGCVIVRDGAIVGEGVTGTGGRPHAEEQALDQAGDRARGARAFVTLEPCAHRTTGRVACADRLVSAGVLEVVVACPDASVHADGQGQARLGSAGIPVLTGLLADEASFLYADYRPA